MLPPFYRGSIIVEPLQLPLAPFLREMHRHTDLTPEDDHAILALPARLRTLDPGSYLIREGDIPTHCCILVEGFVIRQKLTGGGSRQILAVCIPGDAIDFQNMFLDLSDHSVQTLNKVTVADIPRANLQRLVLENAAIGAAIMDRPGEAVAHAQRCGDLGDITRPAPEPERRAPSDHRQGSKPAQSDDQIVGQAIRDDRQPRVGAVERKHGDRRL